MNWVLEGFLAGPSRPGREVMVRMKGLEPSRELPHSDLNAARLPIPPHPHDPASGAGYVAAEPGDEKGDSAAFVAELACPLPARGMIAE